MSDGNIVWLASYPKSGNTWFRIFLANLFADKDVPQDINKLEISTPVAASRGLFANVAGWSSSALNLSELRLLQPSVYRQLSAQQKESCYLKTHEAYTKNASNQFIHAPEASQAVLYFVRNPLDVCLSWANHCGISTDRSIQQMAHSQWLAGKKAIGNSQYAQQTLSWSQHVLTWTQQADMPCLVMRYEDMLAKPEKTFSQAVSFLGLEYSMQQIEKALRFSRFDQLKQQEQQSGFAEKPDKSKAFFRQGKANAWQNELTEVQVQRLLESHGAVMQTFGYMAEASLEVA